MNLARGSFCQWLLCLAFTLAMLYHYVVPLGALPFTKGILGEDCGQMVWNLWVVNEAVSAGHNPYRTTMVYYPAGARNLAYHSMGAGFFPVTFLVKHLSGGSVLYPFYAYRFIILLSFSLILFFSYRTLRRAGFSRWASVIPAVCYAFSDFYMEHAIHLNHLAGFFIPLTALMILRLYQEPGALNAALVALVTGAAIYFTEFSLYIYMAALLMLLLVCTSERGRAVLSEKISRVSFKGALAAFIIFLLVIAPYLFNLLTTGVLKPKPSESSLYSANLAGLFIPDGAQTPLYGQLFAPLRARVTAGMGETGVFMGFPLMLFAALGLLAHRREGLMRLCAIASALFFILSLGPTLKIFGTDTGLPLPYALLARIPPFDAGRTPVRFVVMGLFFLMIVAASGVSRTEEWLRRLAGARGAAIVMSLLLVWAIAELYSPMKRQEAFVPPAALEKVIAGPVLNLPLARNDGYAAMLQTLHGQAIATGYLARYTPAQWQQFTDLERTFYRGGAEFCAEIRGAGFRNIIVAPREVAPDAPSLIPLDLSQCPINVIDLRASDEREALEKEGGPQPARFPRFEPGRRVDFRAPEAEQYLWYGWSGAEECCRWSSAGRAAIIFSLERPAESRLRLSLQPFLVPGKLDQQRVEVSLNGRLLETLYLSDAGVGLYSLSLPGDVLKERNVLTFNLPDAESPAALKLSEDTRLLGINVEWMELEVGQ
jgi:hypothetical protein